MAHNGRPNRNETFGSVSAPAHARPTKTSLKLLGFTFDHTRTNGITILPELQILHPALVFTEVIRFGPQLFMPLALAGSRLSQSSRNVSRMALKELGFHPVEPAFSRFRLSWIQEVGGVTQMLGGMVIINGLQRVIKMQLDQVPNPRRAIAYGLGIIVLLPSSLLGCGPQLLSK